MPWKMISEIEIPQKEIAAALKSFFGAQGVEDGRATIVLLIDSDHVIEFTS